MKKKISEYVNMKCAL